jgi:hypothetical protein
MNMVTELLADERREVSSRQWRHSAGILSASPVKIVAKKVKKYALIVGRSKMKRQKNSGVDPTGTEEEAELAKEIIRTRNQQTSVFFALLSWPQPYRNASVPAALAAISKHSSNAMHSRGATL